MVPITVANGMVLSGFRTRHAGIVAHSIPSIAYNVNVETLLRSEIDVGLVITWFRYAAGSLNNTHKPRQITPTIGSSFRAVVAICVPPTARGPRKLSSTKNHNSDKAVTGGNHEVLLSPGMRTVRYPTTPTAI